MIDFEFKRYTGGSMSMFYRCYVGVTYAPSYTTARDLFIHNNSCRNGAINEKKIILLVGSTKLSASVGIFTKSTKYTGIKTHTHTNIYRTRIIVIIIILPFFRCHHSSTSSSFEPFNSL